MTTGYIYLELIKNIMKNNDTVKRLISLVRCKHEIIEKDFLSTRELLEYCDYLNEEIKKEKEYV